MTEPCFDLAHLAHVEIYTDRYDESLDFFTRIYGLKVSAEDGTSAWLRAWDEYEFHSLKLTRHHTTGVGHIAYRASSAAALGRRVSAVEASGTPVIGWVDGDLGHGRAFRFEDPFGHVFEIYYDTRRFVPEPDDRPALKNYASRYHAQGVSPRRIDHLNLLGEDVSAFRSFAETCLGARVTELIQLDNGRLGGCWFTVNNKTYDLVYSEERGRRQRPAAPRHLRHRSARGHPARRRHLSRERRPHRDRAAQARHSGVVLPLCVGAGGQPGRTGQRRRPADPGAGTGNLWSGPRPTARRVRLGV